MIDFSQITNYGVLGLWTLYLISQNKWYKDKQEAREERLISVIEDNTRVKTLVLNKLGVQNG